MKIHAVCKALTITLLMLSGFAIAKVNINTANVDELSALAGIGKSKAEAIIKYRQEHGDFKKVEDLVEVKGIGEGILNKIKNDIKLEGETDLSDIGKQPVKK